MYFSLFIIEYEQCDSDNGQQYVQNGLDLEQNIQYKTCVQNCNDNVWYTYKQKTEISTLYYQVCATENNACPPDIANNYKFYQSNDSNECVQQCNDFTWYIQDNKFICGNQETCTYSDTQFEYLVIDTKQCLTKEDACNNVYDAKYQYSKNTENKTCVPYKCFFNDYYQDHYETENFTCIDNCNGNVYINYNINQEQVKICFTQDTTCPPQTYSAGSDDYHYILAQTKKLNNLCTDRCMIYNKYVEYNTNNCIDRCQDVQQTKAWKYENKDFYCREIRNCSSVEFQVNTNQECINITQACFDQFEKTFLKSINNCQWDYCTSNSVDMYYSNVYNEEEPYCVYKCEEHIDYLYPVEKYGQTGKARICDSKKQSCPPTSYDGQNSAYINSLIKQYDMHCYQKCSQIDDYGFMSQTDDNVCVQKCDNYFYMTEDNEFKCNVNSSCQENEKEAQIYYDETDLGILCTEQCSNIIVFGQQYYQDITQQNKCIKDCSKWTIQSNEKVCVESCDEGLYIKSDTNECIDASENCPENYIKDDENKQCIRNPCTIENYYYQNTYNQDVQDCQQDCTGHWYNYPVTVNNIVRVCLINQFTCPPQIDENDYRKSQIDVLTKVQASQCVEQCDQANFYYENINNENQCLTKGDCQKQDERRQFTLMKNNKLYYYCSYSNNCNDINYNSVLATKAVNQDNNIIISSYVYVDECQSQVKYSYHDFYQCIKQCGDDAKIFSYELTNQECSTLTATQCKELYHIEDDMYSTKCQYIKDAVNCSDYANYNNQIYQDWTVGNLCTECIDDDQYVGTNTAYCQNNCGIFADQSFKWYKVEGKEQKFCTSSFNCPPNNDTLSNLKYLLQDKNQCQEKECKHADGNKYSHIEDNEFVCTVNPICDINRTIYINQYYSGANQYCLSNCNDNIWYYYMINGLKYKICDIDKTECPPIKPESDSSYDYVDDLVKKAKNQCVVNCYEADQYTVVNYDGTCVEDCDGNVFHRISIDDTSGNTYILCKDRNVCDITSLPPEQTLEDNECKQCKEGYNYVDGETCLQSCIYSEIGNYYSGIQNQSCLHSCENNVWSVIEQNGVEIARCRETIDCIYNDDVKEYTVDNTKQCLLESQSCNEAIQHISGLTGDNIVYYRDDTNHICYINYCKTYNDYYYLYEYNENAYNCVQICKSVYYYHTAQFDFFDKLVKVCDTIKDTCPPSKHQNEEFQYTQLLTKQSGQVCVEHCRDSWKFASKIDNTSCINECENNSIYRYQNDDYYCTQEQECDYDNKKEYQYDIDRTCIQNAQACLSNVLNLFVKNDSEHICEIINRCFQYNLYYVNVYNEAGICTEECSESVSYIYNISYYGNDIQARICSYGTKQCPPQAPDTEEYNYVKQLTIFNRGQCVDKCQIEMLYQTYNRFYSSTANQCIYECENFFWYDENRQQYQCTMQCPPEENSLLTKITYDGKCVEKCRDEEKYKYLSYYDENTCAPSCDGVVWREIEGENVCQEGECIQNETIVEYEVYDDSQCIDIKNGCPDNDEMHYIQDDEDLTCYSNPCYVSTHYYKEKYDENSTDCRDPCRGMWFFYQVNEIRQVRICRNNENSCPPKQLDENQTFDYLSLQYNNQCVQECNSTILSYQSLKQPQYCLRRDFCQQYQQTYLIVQKENKLYSTCTQSYYCDEMYPNLDFYIVKYLYDDNTYYRQPSYICVDQCKMNTWTAVANEKVCTENCGNEPDHFSFDISTYECGVITYDQCMSQYHTELNQYNTKCQYIKDAQGCQDYENYGGYIYEDSKNSKLCVKCDEEGYTVQDNVCTKSKQKLSGGALVGIIVACIVVIALLVLVLSIVIKKKQPTNKQDNNQSSRDLNVASRE